MSLRKSAVSSEIHRLLTNMRAVASPQRSDIHSENEVHVALAAAEDQWVSENSAISISDHQHDPINALPVDGSCCIEENNVPKEEIAAEPASELRPLSSENSPPKDESIGVQMPASPEEMDISTSSSGPRTEPKPDMIDLPEEFRQRVWSYTDAAPLYLLQLRAFRKGAIVYWPAPDCCRARANAALFLAERLSVMLEVPLLALVG
jgi:hypothetical protein